MSITRISKLSDFQLLVDHLQKLGADIPVESDLESGPGSVLSSPVPSQQHVIGNRFAILPMEGWDGTEDGKPTDLVRRRWSNFGRSGAKLIWGGEAVAVRFDGRANPRQMVLNRANVGEIAALRDLLIQEHEDHFGSSSDLSVGLQLTHSGRFARPFPGGRLLPRIAYPHPILDQKFGVDTQRALLTDDELAQLIADFIQAAKLAAEAGFEWVDIKHCHGYLGHELLSGYDRPGRFGGSLENRSRFAREIIQGVRAEVPHLKLGMRLSLFDFVPFQNDADGQGVPMQVGDYQYSFGGDGTGVGIDLSEPIEFVSLLESWGVELLCATAGCPYYVPHLTRPAVFPPSDGYQPPEDPLLGVARQIQAAGELKKHFPNLIVVGSGFSYLQEWLPNVAQAVIRQGMMDMVGIGRMVLSYPTLPADVLAGRPRERKKICRTFSDCTSAPRNGLVSGCYPLDPFYKDRPEFEQLKELKKNSR